LTRGAILLAAAAALLAAAACLRTGNGGADAGAAREDFRSGVEALVNRDDDAAARDWARCLDNAPAGSREESDCRLFSGMLRERLASKAPARDDGEWSGAWAAAPLEAAPSAPPKDAPLRAQQAYLEGVIYYEKGDFATARTRWSSCAAADSDCGAGLEKLDELFDSVSSTAADGKK
jgi:hypothetical protein